MNKTILDLGDYMTDFQYQPEIMNIEQTQNYDVLVQALAQIEDLVVITDKNGIIEYVNPAFEKFTGYTKDEVVGRKSNVLNSGRQSDEQYKYLWNTILEGKTYSAEITNKKKDQKLFFESKTITPIKNSCGEITHFISIGKDVTSKKEIEDIFENRWSDFKKLFDNISDVLMVISKDGVIKYCSPSIKVILGYTLDEMIGGNLYSIIDDLDSDELKNLLNKNYLKDNKEINGKIKINHKDGSQLYFETKIKELINDRILIEAKDVTGGRAVDIHLKKNIPVIEKESANKLSDLKEVLNKLKLEIEWRKELEAQMLNNNDRLELMLDVTEQGIFDFDFVTGKFYFNDNFCQILGYPRKVLNNFVIKDWFELIHPEDLWSFRKQMFKHIKMQADYLQSEFRIMTNEKETKWILCRGKITQRDEKNEPIRFIGKIEDICLRKKSEQEMIRLLNTERELNKAKSNFISIVSHEFRTPLSTILSSSDLLHSFGNELNINEKEKQFSRIEKSVDLLTELLNGVLTLNKTNAEKQNVKLSSIEIIGLCRHFIEEVSSSIKNSPVIHFNSNVDRCTIISDENLLHHIIMNILKNAIKYNRNQNDIKVNVEIDNNVLISIEDQGIGIKKEDQNNLFDPFFRGSNSIGISGTGLGLAIAKNYVKLLNGELWLNSESGTGSSFYINLPITNKN